MPGIFIHHRTLERTETGKVIRSRLPNPKIVTRGTSPQDKPQTETERALSAIWCDLLERTDFGRSEDFFDIGGDSLQAMSMLTATNAKFGINIPLEGFILEGASLRVITERIDWQLSTIATDQAPVLKAGEDGAPLFAMHAAGGHLSDYLALLNAIEGRQTVLGIHPRGMDFESKPDGSIESMAKHAADLICQHGSLGPHRLIGYSFGGVLVYETARVLLARGEAVSPLILLDPGVPWRDPVRLVRAVYRAARRGGRAEAWSTVSRTVPAALGLRGTPEDLEEAHQAAMLRYKPLPLALTGAVLISADQNPLSGLIRSTWQKLVGADLKIESIDADHMSLLKPPGVWPVAQIVSLSLDD